MLFRLLWYGYTFRRIPLTQGKYAIVDVADYDRLKEYKWHAQRDDRTFYAVRAMTRRYPAKRKSMKMHRQITRARPHQIVDHINHNGLDNRRANLRLTTGMLNSKNRRKRATSASSKYKGVSFGKAHRNWMAGITADKKKHHLGYFKSEREAAKAYDNAARKHHGEFASLNFPDGH